MGTDNPINRPFSQAASSQFKKHSSKSQLLVISTVTIILIGGITSYYLISSKQIEKGFSMFSPLKQGDQNTQTNGDTHNKEKIIWNTYTDKERNYTIQYPKSWKLVTFENGSITFRTINENDEELINLGSGAVDIVTPEFINNQDISYSNLTEQEFYNPDHDFWLKGDSEISEGYVFNFSSPEQMTIDGKKAIKQQMQVSESSLLNNPQTVFDYYYIWLGNPKNEILRITFSYNRLNPDKNSLINTYKYILSSFELTI